MTYYTRHMNKDDHQYVGVHVSLDHFGHKITYYTQDSNNYDVLHCVCVHVS